MVNCFVTPFIFYQGQSGSEIREGGVCSGEGGVRGAVPETAGGAVGHVGETPDPERGVAGEDEGRD